MEDWHSVMRGYGERPDREVEFDEEDVWNVFNEGDDSSPPSMKKSEISPGSCSAWRLPTVPRQIPRASNSLTYPEDKIVQQSSAPLDIPDWSKVYGKNASMSSWVDHGNRGNISVNVLHHNICSDHDGYNDDDGEDDDGIVPPHEYIAKRLARSHISSFSVCEGMGRTLKGRDLSKVRNAILTKTGFLE